MARSGKNKKNDTKFFYYDISEDDMKNNGLYYDDTATIGYDNWKKDWDRKWAKERREREKKNAKYDMTSNRLDFILGPSLFIVGVWQGAYGITAFSKLLTTKFPTTISEADKTWVLEHFATIGFFGALGLAAITALGFYFAAKGVITFADAIADHKKVKTEYRKYFKKKRKKKVA